MLQQKDAVEKNQSAWASLSGVTKDFFTDLLTNGTKAFGNLWQTIKKFFIDLAAQFATKFVINAVLGGSIAGSSTGIAGSLINSLFSGGRGGDGIGGGGEGSMLGAGASAIGMLGGISSSVGAMTSAYTGAMAAGQGFLGSIGAAGTALTTSGGVLGAAAGVLAAIPVWGWAILAAGALYAAFGGKRDPGFKVDNNLTNVGNSASHFTDSAISKFDISGRGTDSAEYQAAFKPFVSAVQALDKMLAEQLLGADTLAKIRANMNAVNNASSWENLDKAGIEKGTTAFLKQRYGVIFDEVDAKIAATVRGFTGTSDQLLQFIASVVNVMGALKDNATYFKSVLGQTITVGELAALATAGETLTQTLTRVVTVFSATNGVAALMGKDVSTAFGAVGLASLAARQNLIDLAGGIQALDALSKSYYQNYYSDSERAAMKLKGDTAAIKATFDSLGIAVPLSVADMRKLIEAQDLATVAGRATWAALMKVADAFYAVNGAAAAVVAPGSLLTINRPGPNTEAISRAGLESTAAVVMRLAEQQSNSVLAAYNAQSTATQTLLTTANGSVGALSAVTAGMYAMRDATAAFLMQVMQTKASIDSMLTNTITTLKLQGMTKEEQYAFYQAQADTARQRSLTSTDPLEIQRQAQIVNNAVNSAQSLLTAEQRAQTNPTQIANLEKYNAQVQANLDKVAKDAKDASDAFLAKLDAKFKVITDAQGDIQKKGSEAADKNLLAANTRKRFEVGFTANVPGFSQITEVGG